MSTFFDFRLSDLGTMHYTLKFMLSDWIDPATEAVCGVDEGDHEFTEGFPYESGLVGMDPGSNFFSEEDHWLIWEV